MKKNYIAGVLVLAMVLVILGGLFEAQNWAIGSMMLTAAYILLVASGGLLVLQLFLVRE
ncbi:hypothetical protein [Croceiramulus getboli]|nr:hypothetical protein P8624_12905 [Flavobacteriaceae bacterium YJPT1-3]